MLLTNVCSIHYPAKIRQYFFEKTDFEGLAMGLTIEGSKQGVIRGGSEREY